jgi:hypothetical protein
MLELTLPNAIRLYQARRDLAAYLYDAYAAEGKHETAASYLKECGEYASVLLTLTDPEHFNDLAEIFGLEDESDG